MIVKLKITLDLLGTNIYVEARLIHLIQEGRGVVPLQPLSLSLTTQDCIRICRRTHPSLSSCVTPTSLWALFGTPPSNLSSLYSMKYIENSIQAQIGPSSIKKLDHCRETPQGRHTIGNIQNTTLFNHIRVFHWTTCFCYSPSPGLYCSLVSTYHCLNFRHVLYMPLTY